MEFTNDIYFNDNLIENEKCQITYSGKLFQNNSDSVKMVYGFGDNWSNTTEKLMEKNENGFVAEIEMLNFDKLNFCFRNSNNEWDNNNNCNYISSILPPVLPTFIEEKTSLLEDILSEPSQEIQTFNIDSLIEEILNPVINFSEEIKEQSENISLSVDTIVESSYIQEIESSNTTESSKNYEFNQTVIEDIYKMFDLDQNTAQEVETVNNTSLVTINTEDKFIVSPRKLSTFYRFKKKIKLALYKALVTIPKLLSGQYENNKN